MSTSARCRGCFWRNAMTQCIFCSSRQFRNALSLKSLRCVTGKRVCRPCDGRVTVSIGRSPDRNKEFGELRFSAADTCERQVLGSEMAGSRMFRQSYVFPRELRSPVRANQSTVNPSFYHLNLFGSLAAMAFLCWLPNSD